ncbi:MAG: saccharopine dehydrogenase NADP-binding domain-containing protein [Solirubrobacterales bacterium]
MAGRIVVFGTTGYTGEHTARALVGRGARPVLAGRSRERLERLAEELGGLETMVADVDRPATVRALVDRGDVLLSTVGPFSRFGEPAVDAAIDAGATYVDSTGEPAFIRRVFCHHGPRAEHAGVALLTAFGFDWVPGNLAGALALREAGDRASRVEVGYFTGGDVSGGTRASTVRAALEPSFAFRDGRLRAEPAGRRVRAFTLPKGVRRRAISVGGTEHFGLPATHPHVRDVDVLLGQAGPHVRAMPVISRALGAALALPGVRRRLLALADDRMHGSTGGPDEAARGENGSTVLARAYADDGSCLGEVTLKGVDPYTFTFEILAWAACRLVDDGSVGRGALVPVQAFTLDLLQEGVRQAGLDRMG